MSSGDPSSISDVQGPVDGLDGCLGLTHARKVDRQGVEAVALEVTSPD